MNKNVKRYLYWKRLNRLPELDFIRAQRLHTYLFGGWIKGLSLQNGKVSFVIDKAFKSLTKYDKKTNRCS